MFKCCRYLAKGINHFWHLIKSSIPSIRPIFKANCRFLWWMILNNTRFFLNIDINVFFSRMSIYSRPKLFKARDGRVNEDSWSSTYTFNYVECWSYYPIDWILITDCQRSIEVRTDSEIWFSRLWVWIDIANIFKSPYIFLNGTTSWELEQSWQVGMT